MLQVLMLLLEVPLDPVTAEAIMRMMVLPLLWNVAVCSTAAHLQLQLMLLLGGACRKERGLHGLLAGQLKPVLL
jgi:hypothetical protein